MMRVFVRLVGGIWLATLLVTGVFAYVEIHAERTRLEQDLQRRTSLVVEALRDSAAPVVGKGSRAAVERVVRRFARADRGVALFDGFGSLIDASTDVKAHLGPLSPLVSDATAATSPFAGCGRWRAAPRSYRSSQWSARTAGRTRLTGASD